MSILIKLMLFLVVSSVTQTLYANDNCLNKSEILLSTSVDSVGDCVEVSRIHKVQDYFYCLQNPSDGWDERNILAYWDEWQGLIQKSIKHNDKYLVQITNVCTKAVVHSETQIRIREEQVDFSSGQSRNPYGSQWNGKLCDQVQGPYRVDDLWTEEVAKLEHAKTYQKCLNHKP